MKNNLCRAVCGLLAAVMMLAAVSCKNQVEDDKTMTRELMEKKLNALTSFDINAFNENNLCRQDEYSDSESVKASCKVIAGKISYEIKSIGINGNAAVAQIDINLPINIDEVCQSALNDVMSQLSGNAGASIDGLLSGAIKRRASELNMQQIASEVTMNKIGDKWYIASANDLSDIISDIRIPVAAVYSVIE